MLYSLLLSAELIEPSDWVSTPITGRGDPKDGQPGSVCSSTPTMVRPHDCDVPYSLRSTPYVVNTKYRALICIQCLHAVEPQSAVSHISKHHPQCVLLPNAIQEVRNAVSELKSSSIHPGEAIPAVYGLEIHHGYIVCACCLHGYKNERTLRSHVCVGAPNPTTLSSGSLHPSSSCLSGPPVKFFNSSVQTFFIGKYCVYFPVTIPEPGETGREPTSSHYDLWMQRNKPISDGSQQPSLTEDHRQLQMFLRKQGWLDHVHGLKAEELSALVQAPGPDDNLPHLEHLVYQLMDRLQSAIGSSGFLLQRLIGKRPS